MFHAPASVLMSIYHAFVDPYVLVYKLLILSGQGNFLKDRRNRWTKNREPSSPAGSIMDATLKDNDYLRFDKYLLAVWFNSSQVCKYTLYILRPTTSSYLQTESYQYSCTEHRHLISSGATPQCLSPTAPSLKTPSNILSKKLAVLLCHNPTWRHHRFNPFILPFTVKNPISNSKAYRTQIGKHRVSNLMAWLSSTLSTSLTMLLVRHDSSAPVVRRTSHLCT